MSFEPYKSLLAINYGTISTSQPSEEEIQTRYLRNVHVVSVQFVVVDSLLDLVIQPLITRVC